MEGRKERAVRGASRPTGRNASGDRREAGDSLEMRSKHLRPRTGRGAEVDGRVDAGEEVVFLICEGASARGQESLIRTARGNIDGHYAPRSAERCRPALAVIALSGAASCVVRQLTEMEKFVSRSGAVSFGLCQSQSNEQVRAVLTVTLPFAVVDVALVETRLRGRHGGTGASPPGPRARVGSECGRDVCGVPESRTESEPGPVDGV